MAGGLNEHARTHADKLVLSDGSISYTAAELNTRVNQMIQTLWADGVGPGDAAAVMAANSAEFVVLVCAAALGGVSLVPVNWHLTPKECRYILESSGAKALFVDGEHSATGSEAAALAGCEIIYEIGPALGDRIQRQVPEEPPLDTRFASPIYFTSGTTGRPKSTRMAQTPTARPVREAVTAFKRASAGSGMGADAVHLVQGPLYHAGPLAAAFTTVMLGGTVHVMPHFDAEQMLRLIERHRVTHTLMVPIMFVRLLRLPAAVRDRYDVSSLKSVFHIAAPMPVDVKRQMIEWWGPVLIDGYGASEIGVVTRITSEEWLKKPGSVGRPVKSLSLQIVGDDDQELPLGEIGVIYITGRDGTDLVYLDDPKKTRAAHRGKNQFTLGDMGYLDEDGYLFLADRRVDLIISGGVNIYPAEIEAELMSHSAVDDVGVFGIPSDEWGQDVKAAIQLRPGRSSSSDLEAEILSWLRDRIAHHKVPKSIDFHRQLPRYSNGKLHRRVLREVYWPTEDGARRV